MRGPLGRAGTRNRHLPPAIRRLSRKARSCPCARARECGRRERRGGIDGPMSAVEFGILGLYFLTLVILAIMGFHRYVMVWLYFKHRDKKAAPAPLPAVPAARHRPAADLQRDVRGRPAARVGRGDPLPEGPARDPGPRRLDRRDDRDRQPRGRALPRAGLRHPLPAPRPTAPATRPAPSTRACERATGEFVLIFDADFVAPPDILEKTLGHFEDPKVGHGAGALGPHQPRLLAAHRGAVDHARRALHHRARRAQPLGPLLQLQRHRRHLAPQR